jgi:hypothetical protein
VSDERSDDRMLVEGQKVKVRWNGRNKRHFISFGYLFTKLGDEIQVDPLHLTKGSDATVKVKCDYCTKVKDILFNQYFTQVIKPKKNKYCCKECSSKKITEEYENNLKGFVNHTHCDTDSLKGIVYEITEKYNHLSNEQKMLVNEIQRFCEEKGQYPTEKEMTKKNGFISRTQYYKFFNTNKFTDIYEYIYPLQKETRVKKIVNIQKEKSKPKFYKCRKCEVEKEFNESNFNALKAGKYGLRTICKECETYYAFLQNYKRKGIVFEKFEDISPLKWWEYYYNGTIGLMPDFCSSKDNIIKIIRYVVLDVLKFNREMICNDKMFNQEIMKEYKIWHLYTKIYNKYEVISLCFPEMNIKPFELSKTRYTEENIVEFIDYWISENEFSISDLLEFKYTTKEDNKMTSLIATKFDSYVQMLTWYLDKKRISHPLYSRKIEIFDFSSRPNYYWNEEENRINAIRTYCVDRGILSVINNTDELKKWIYQNFKMSQISRMFTYNIYYNSLYDLLVTVFPEIIENKILFRWEWHQWNRYDDILMIEMMREYVFYRLKLNDHKEIAKRIRYVYFSDNGMNKFNKLLYKGKYSNYYEWCIDAFPEFKEKWTPDDFGLFYTCDGYVCDSYEEVKIYEFIKKEMKIENIIPIGAEFLGTHTFILPSNHQDNWYCPDYIIENLLDKSLYIEYFGLYSETKYFNNEMLMDYREKTKRKIKYYETQTHAYFIYLFRDDLESNFEGVKEKISKLLHVV